MDRLEELLNSTPTVILVPDHSCDCEVLWHGARRALEFSVPHLNAYKAWDTVLPHLRNAIHVAAVFRLSGAADLNAWAIQYDLFRAGRTPGVTAGPIVMTLVRSLLADETRALQRMLIELDKVLYAYSAAPSKNKGCHNFTDAVFQSFLSRLEELED